ncbi:SIR2 family protein [Absicoccus porci]|uniref:SIR2 family protein n=1 Tax=Absicoccus porci TaxID=2486576 RepID=UPI00294274EF|nr:SIR2 family protein [Absicoccus porci]
MDTIEIKTKEDTKSLLEVLEGKNINFLIGSGASMPFLKTLAIEGSKHSFEDLYTEACNQKRGNAIDFLNAYLADKSLIKGSYNNIINNQESLAVRQEYSSFIHNVYDILQRTSIQQPRRVNIFTTNYDMFFECCFDEELKQNNYICINDGSCGFVNKTITTQRYHQKVMNVGVDNRFDYELPMFNLIKLHGSLNWTIKNEKITIDNNLFDNYQSYEETSFSYLINLCNINDVSYIIDQLDNFKSQDCKEISQLVNSLLIVKPKKDKFEETVFQEHYYQCLRIFSQELERNQSVLIVFGFSFADEHIYSILKRSLVNPGLLVFVICYNEDDKRNFEEKFKDNYNVKLIVNQMLKSNNFGDFKFVNYLLSGGFNCE